jgi:hypothetical protein
MRSPTAVAGAIILLLGVPLAFVAASVFENAAQIIIHFALGASFVLFARSVLDFGLPKWVSALSFAAIGVLAIVFLLQGAADLLHSAQLRHLAYDVLGQRLERVLGYAFLLWCAAVLAVSSKGWTKLVGAVLFAVIVCAELYSVAMTLGGGRAPEPLKLFYLPLFVWLLVEGAKLPRPTGHLLEQG